MNAQQLFGLISLVFTLLAFAVLIFWIIKNMPDKGGRFTGRPTDRLFGLGQALMLVSVASSFTSGYMADDRERVATSAFGVGLFASALLVQWALRVKERRARVAEALIQNHAGA